MPAVVIYTSCCDDGLLIVTEISLSTWRDRKAAENQDDFPFQMPLFLFYR